MLSCRPPCTNILYDGSTRVTRRPRHIRISRIIMHGSLASLLTCDRFWEAAAGSVDSFIIPHT